MSSLPPEALQALQQLLSSLMSPDNAIRSSAESSLNNEWVNGGPERAEMLLLGLAEQASGGEPESIRSFAAVIFRRISTSQAPGDSAARLIDSVSTPVLAQIKAVLLQGFMNDQPKDARHKISDAISQVVRPDAKEKNEWPELLSVLFQASKNDNENIRESAFRIFASVPDLVGESLLANIIPVFAGGFEDSSEDVRISAVKAFVSFFQTLPRSTWPTLQGLLMNLLSVLNPLRTHDKSIELASVLESLIDLAGLAPKMFRPVFKTIIDFCIEVAKDKEMDLNARLSALELATTFADEAPNMCKKEPTYADQMVLQCLLMMTEVGEDDDDAADWQNEDDVMSSEDQDEAYSAAKQSLDRLCLKLSGKVMAAPLFHWLPTLIGSVQWRERHAALIAISNAVEGCRDILLGELDKILDIVIPRLDDDHCRVQWAACNALGQMSTDFAPEIQQLAGNRILPALIGKLGSQSTPRVQAHAAAALVNFSENASKDILDPYLDALLNGLLILLQSPKRYVQEQCVTTIAIVADSAQTLFMKYYDTLMPLLFNVMKVDTGKEDRLLKAKSIECATLIAVAVGKEKFMPQCAEMTQIFASIQETITEEDDPCLNYLVHGWGRLCRILGSDFKPYLPAVMPQLMEMACYKPDFKIFETEADVEQIEEKEGWEILPVHGRYVGIHIALLDEKASAIELITVYASELGADFAEYVPQIMEEVISKCLNFFYHDGVRYTAAAATPHLLQCIIARNSRETNDLARAKQDPSVLGLWIPILSKILDVLNVDVLVETVAAMYGCISTSIELIGSPTAMDANDMHRLTEVIGRNLNEFVERVNSRHEGENDEYTEDVDGDDAEDADAELVGEINKAVHSVFKICREKFLPYFKELIPLIMGMLSHNSVDCRQCALYMLDDMLEYTGPHSAEFQGSFLPKMIDALLDSDAVVRQAAAYGIGVAAQHGGESYAEATISTLETLFNVVRLPDARSEENVQVTENVCAAIAKILRKNGQYLGGSLDQAIVEWLNSLPVVTDEEPAAYAYMFLADLIERSHPCVSANTDRIFDAVAQALVLGSIRGRTAERVVQAMRQMLSQMGQDQAMALFQKLPVESQETVQKWFH